MVTGVDILVWEGDDPRSKEEASDETECIGFGFVCRRDGARARRIGGRGGRYHRDQPGQGAGERRRSLPDKHAVHKLSSHRQSLSSGQYQWNRFERILEYRARRFERVL